MLLLRKKKYFQNASKLFQVYKKVGAREVFAVKCVPRAKLRQCEMDSIVSEISMLKKLKHPNIVQMEDFAWDSNYIYIMMGKVMNYIRAEIHSFLF